MAERPTIFNLSYHCAPFIGSEWRVNIDRLLRHKDKFNGRKIVGIVYGEGLECPQTVIDLMPKDYEYVVQPNSHALRDATTLNARLRLIDTNDPKQATCFCHTKGVRPFIHEERPYECTRRWRDTMYRDLLNDFDRVAEKLTHKASCGAYRMSNVEPGAALPIRGWLHWHYPGSFYWIRNDELKGAVDMHIHAYAYAAEAMPGYLHPWDRSDYLGRDDWKGHVHNFASFGDEG